MLHLVNFNQAGSLEIKNLHYARMLSLSRISLNVISPEKYAYFSKWYHAALRELLFYTPFKDDYKALGRKLDPPVPAQAVKKAIQLLEKLGMIAKDAGGFYKQTAALITTDGLGETLHVENFQTETMKLAMESIGIPRKCATYPRSRRPCPPKAWKKSRPRSKLCGNAYWFWRKRTKRSIASCS